MVELPKERPDDLDRVKSPASEKLLLLCQWCREQLGVDPRGDGAGISFVARPRVVEQLFNDLPILLREHAPTVVVGTVDADIVFKWQGVPIRVRSNVKDDKLHALRDKQLPESSQPDRRLAGEMRWAIKQGRPMLPPIKVEA